MPKPTRNVGRPCQGDAPRTVSRTVRLSPAEAAALDDLNISLSELLRAIAIGRIKSDTKSLPRAS